MTTGRVFRTTLTGEIRFRSGLLSNDWTMVADGTTVARLRRIPSRHMSIAVLGDGTHLELRPEGWGTVVAIGDNHNARVIRESWWGRHWSVLGLGFAYDLTSDPLPRRWTLRVGGHPVARIAGTAWSYNRITVQADVGVPIHALILSWHVLARPWEAAAAPRSLRPQHPRPIA